ncbi:YceK/YidQ family lipoprotein [Pseudomonas sp. SCB32]|uniref:YceK/YidQ family lipoprotein n=1 Tax=Pseudomonas sp. SCB32 TaxID=2653853 RepID=UPI0012651124|nr:YceK/YidQ family lipoprotein [Pseudomonas sp. SCB32]
MMHIRMTALLLLAVGLSGCGSLHTLGSDEVVNASDIKLQGTYCDVIPRVYSGVTYDLCWMHGERFVPRGGVSGATVIWPLADMLLSGVTDTVSLPYTLYRQHRDGSIELRRD